MDLFTQKQINRCGWCLVCFIVGKDAYKIMKESTIGAIGALYGVAFVLLKVGIITYVLYEKTIYFIFDCLCFFQD